MKQSLALLVMAIAGVVALPGCSKNSSNAYSMNATINGVAFACNNCVASASSTALNITGANFNSSGGAGFFPNIVLYISNYTGIGIYSLTHTAGILSSAAIDSGATIYSAYTAYDSAAIVSTNGTITVSTTSPKITGTFSFTTSDSTKVTNGTFAAKTP